MNNNDNNRNKLKRIGLRYEIDVEKLTYLKKYTHSLI